MKRLTVLTLTCLFAVAGVAGAQQDVIEATLEACKPEIETYCDQVTLGDGRLLACFVAHEDKLSGSCSWALYQGMAAFEDFANAVFYVASSCEADLMKHCGEVEMGEGRVASCLLEHKAEVAPECKAAIDDVGLEVVEE